MGEILNPLREEGEFSQEKIVDDIKKELESLETRKTYLLELLEHYEPSNLPTNV